jgi:hypothetical protein
MKYDIIIVLCPWKKVDCKFPEFLNGKYVGGQTRMDATCEIYKKNKQAEFIIVGGYNENSEESDKVRDMKNFLKEKCPEIIIKECPSLPCTRHNLVAIFNTWRRDPQDLQGKKIGLLTNFYHLPRTLRFWSELVTIKDFRGKKIPTPFPICAESIVKDMSSGVYTRFIEYFLVLESERLGLKDIEKEKYRDSCLMKNFNEFKKLICNKKTQKILLTKEEIKKIKIYAPLSSY